MSEVKNNVTIQSFSCKIRAFLFSPLPLGNVTALGSFADIVLGLENTIKIEEQTSKEKHTEEKKKKEKKMRKDKNMQEDTYTITKTHANRIKQNACALNDTR